MHHSNTRAYILDHVWIIQSWNVVRRKTELQNDVTNLHNKSPRTAHGEDHNEPPPKTTHHHDHNDNKPPLIKGDHTYTPISDDNKKKVLIPGLPCDIAMFCLGKISPFELPAARLVSKAWRDILHSSEMDQFCFKKNLFHSIVFVGTFDVVIPDTKRLDNVLYCVDAFTYDRQLIPLPSFLSTERFKSSVCYVQGINELICLTADSKLSHNGYTLNVKKRVWKKFKAETDLPNLPADTICTTAHDFAYFAYRYKSAELLEPEVTIQKMNLLTKQWSVVPLSQLPLRTGAMNWNGKFCLVGDCKNLSAELWNPEQNNWELAPAIWPEEMFNKDMYRPKIAIIREHMYALKEETMEMMQYTLKVGWRSRGKIIVNSKDVTSRILSLLAVNDELWTFYIGYQKRRTIKVCAAKACNHHRSLVWKELPIEFSGFLEDTVAIQIF